MIFGRSDNLGFITVDFTHSRDFELVVADDSFVSVSTDNNLLYIGGTPDQYPPRGLLMTDETVISNWYPFYPVY